MSIPIKNYGPEFLADLQAPEGAELPNVAQTAPKSIYLVIGEDCPPEADFNELGRGMELDGVTWCADKIDANSIKYIRADLAAQPRAARLFKESAEAVKETGAVFRQVLRELETARDYITKSLEGAKEAYRGHPDHWAAEERDLADTDAAIAAAYAALAAQRQAAMAELPDIDLCRLISTHEVYQYHPGALHEFAHEVIAEFCRVNGIPAPQTKEPANDR